MNVVVVGGGAAGLAAAYTLRRRGVDVTLLEAGPRAGGRMAADEVDGFRIDTGAQMFSSTYTAAIRLCEELNIPLEPFSPIIGFYGKDKFHVLASNRSARDVWTNLKTLVRALSPKGLWQALRFARILRSQAKHLSFSDHSRMLHLDAEASIADVIRRTGGDELLEELLQNNITALTLGHPEDVGAAFGMALLWVFIWDTAADLLTPTEGIGAFATALARACEKDIRVSTPVERVVVEDGTVKGVTTRQGFIGADAVICATTATVALKIIPDLPASISRVLRKVTYSSGCQVVFGVDKPVFPEGWFGVSFPRRTGSFMVNCNDGALKASLSAPQGKRYLSAFLFNMQGQAGDPLALSDEEVERRVMEDLRACGIHVPVPPLFTRVYRWPEAVCLAPGGMLKAIDHMRHAAHPGCQGLFLAGEYMRLPSVNGALISGVDAAEEAMGFLLAGKTEA